MLHTLHLSYTVSYANSSKLVSLIISLSFSKFMSKKSFLSIFVAFAVWQILFNNKIKYIGISISDSSFSIYLYQSEPNLVALPTTTVK